MTVRSPSLSRQLRRKKSSRALGVEGPRDVGGPPDGGRHRELDDPRVAAALGHGGGPIRQRRHRRRRLRAGVDQPVMRGRPRIGRVPAREAAHGPRGGRARGSAAGRASSVERLHRVDRGLLRLGPRREVSGGHRLRHGLLVPSGLHAEQTLLEIAVDGQFGGRHGAGDAPVHHHVDGVGDVDGHAQVLLDQQHRDLALAGQALQHLGDLLHDHRGQPFGGLVHDQEDRVQEQRAGDGQHLLLAARELGAPVGPALGQTRKGLVDARHRPRAAAAAHGQAQVLVDAQRGPDAAALGDVADPPLGDGVGRQAQDVLAGQPHAARGGDQPGDGVAERGLAHPVAPDHRDDPVVERQRHLLQGVGAAVVDVEPLHLEDRPRRSPRAPAREPGHQARPPPM